MKWTGGLVAFAALAYFSIPYLLPRVLEVVFPDVTFRFPSNERVVYLTIDDSPSNGTESIVRVLVEHRTPATFFVIGGRMQRYPAARISEEFKLGNHFDTTKRFSELSDLELERSFLTVESYISPEQHSGYYRMPSDFGTGHQRDLLRKYERVPIMGTAFPFDSTITNESLLVWLTKWLVVPGSVIILHDGDGRGPRTASVLNRLIPKLKSEGYRFESLPPARTTNP